MNVPRRPARSGLEPSCGAFRANRVGAVMARPRVSTSSGAAMSR